MIEASCVILAGGKGERFGGKKQFLELFGKPLFMYPLEKALKLFEEVLLVLPKEDLSRVKVPRRVKLVEGGKERQDSVLNALLECNKDLVVIHDAVRPLAGEELFLKVVELENYDGKIVAIPVRDTVKEVMGDRVIRTLDRTKLWLSQTPQAFKRKVLLECHFKARNEGFYSTDDSALLERYGYRVGITMGSFLNLKVTYKEDLEILRLLAYNLKDE